MNGAGEDLYLAVRLAPARWIVSGRKDRDARGRTVAVTDPFYWDAASLPTARPSVAPVQTIRYDGLDRPIEQVNAKGARQVTDYTATR